MHQRFLRTLLLSVISLILMLISINLAIDPFATNRWLDITGLNHSKPEAGVHERLVKLFDVYRLKPEAITLGSSRTQYGLYIDGARWGNAPIYNFGVSAPGIDEVHRLLAHATAQGKLKEAIIGLDFFMFNADFLLPGMEKFNNSALSYPGDLNPFREWTAMLSTAASLDTLDASWSTFQFNQHIQKNDPDVLPRNPWPTALQHYDSRHMFLRHATDYLDVFYFPKSTGRFVFQNAARGSMFEHFRQIVRFSYQHHIDARFFISPSNAWQWEVIDAAGLWPQFEYWKRQLVIILNEEATFSGRPAFPLWDFSGYNSITSQTVPACGSHEAMSHYFDASHYKPAVGQLVLDRALSQNTSSVPDDFGVQITPSNIESDLVTIRRDRERWRSAHPADHKEIWQLAARVFSKEKSTYDFLCPESTPVARTASVLPPKL